MPPPEEAARFPETVDHKIHIRPGAAEGDPASVRPGLIVGDGRVADTQPGAEDGAPGAAGAVVDGPDAVDPAAPEHSGTAAHVHRAAVAGGAVSLEQRHLHCEVEGGGRDGEGAAVASRDVADQAAVAEFERAAADRPAVAVIAGALAGVAVSRHDPVQPQPRAVHVEDPVDVVAVDDRQLRAALALLSPQNPFVSTVM